MKRASVLGGLLCLASIVWGADRSLLDLADALFNQGRYDEAIAAYSAVIRAEPMNIRAYLQAGRAHVAKERYDDAVAAYNEGLQQNPNRALRYALYQELGVVYSKQGRYDEAITALREATKLVPRDFHAHYMLGTAYVQKGLQREALAAFNQALRLAKASPGGKEFVPSIEAMLRDNPPQAPSPPTPPPPEKFKLTVRAVPADSTVKLENSKTEYRPGLEVLPGRYELVVSREGYKTARRQVTVSDADVTLEVTLDQEKYKLTVQATPADSTIKFDNSQLDYRPGMEIPAGRYELVVIHEGYKTARHTVTVSKTDVSLKVPLEPAKYKLTVRATPADSTVQLDQSNLEYRPGMEVPPGRYEITVRREGYKPARSTITVSTADVTLDVALEGEKTYKLTVHAVPAASTVKFDNSQREYRPGMELAPGRYDLVVTHDGYKPARRQVTVSTADVTLDMALEPAKAVPVVDTSPPRIALKQDSIPKNVGPTQSRVTVIGQATDDSGVAEVAVNGKKAELGADGTFAVEVLLRVGENPIRVTALDIYGNVGEETFTISRESARLPESPQPTSAPSPAPTIPATGAELPPNPAPSASTPTVTIQRYLTMEAPEEVIPDQEFAIQVAFTMEQLTPEVKVVSGTTTTEGQLALSLPAQPAQDSWKIDVVMSAPDFTFRAGMNTSALVLPRQGDSTPAVFYLRAKPIRGGRQARNVYVTLWYRGAFLGKVTRQITIVAPKRGKRAAFAAPSPVASRVSVLPPSPLGQPIALSLGGLPPDLTVFLLDKEGIMLLQSPHLQPSQHAFSTPKQLADWLNTQYAHFAQEAERGLVKPDTDAVKSLPRRERRLALLRGVGRELYQKVAPTAFKDAFWRLRDQLGARFQSIQIYSSNPLLPWELMRPSRANGAEERDFLGVEFRMARWHLSQGGTQLERPPQTMPLQELAVIAPQYTGVLFLPNQASEIQALQLVAGYRRVPGQLALVQGLFAHVPAGIVHFSGHGVVQEKSKGIFEYAIRLEDVELDLLTWRGLASQQPQEHPFIFFNACDIGQAHRVANFVSGWAPAMLEAGASGYIGGLWSLGDKGAATFAAHFYQRLQQELAHGPVTVAEVIREARRLVYTDGDPTFLAYVYYGDPNFQFMRRP